MFFGNPGPKLPTERYRLSDKEREKKKKYTMSTTTTTNMLLQQEQSKTEPEMDIAMTMAMILGTMVAILFGLISVQQTKKKKKKPENNKTMTTTDIPQQQQQQEGIETSSLSSSSSFSSSSFFPCAKTQPSKRAYELFVAYYTPIWILAFAIVICFQLYEEFDAWGYLQFCGGLSLPLLLQPIVFPSAGQSLLLSPDCQRPLWERYSFKANVWIAIYSFIGNYWYTHYFYSVLKAQYTMPAHRLNNVPLAMFCATHFYFSTYHFFSNALLRKVVTTYEPGLLRTTLFVGVVIVFSYFTAFMETLTISSYPYYDFEDRYMAYTVGSAFYGIYFLVSFPAFFTFDDDIDMTLLRPTTTTANGMATAVTTTTTRRRTMTLWDTIVSSCGHGMMILCLLDFVRLFLNIPLVVGVMPYQQQEQL